MQESKMDKLKEIDLALIELEDKIKSIGNENKLIEFRIEKKRLLLQKLELEQYKDFYN